MKISVGNELYVNGKWFMDVLNVTDGNAIVQISYLSAYPGDTERKSANMKIPLTAIVVGDEIRKGVYAAKISGDDVKKYFGGLSNSFIKMENIYSMLSLVEGIKTMNKATLNKNNLSDKALVLLSTLEKSDPEKYTNEQWDEFADIIGVPRIVLVKYIFEVYCDGLEESKIPMLTSFNDFVAVNRLFEDGVACASAANTAGMGAVTVTATAAPSVAGVPGSGGSDLSVGSFPVSMKEPVGTEQPKKKKKKKTLKEVSSFGNLDYNKSINADNEKDYALVKIQDMTSIKKILAMRTLYEPYKDYSHEKTDEDGYIGDEACGGFKPGAYSTDMGKNIRNLLKQGTSTAKLTESAGDDDSDAAYKEKLYSFLDYPWGNIEEKEMIEVLSEQRDRYADMSETDIQAKFQQYWVEVKNLKKKLTDQFISDFMVLGNITETV